MKRAKYQGIEGVEGKEPVMAVLSLGIKEKNKGFPIERDRFHIVVPREADGMRPLHPAFSAFNSASVDKRKVISGNIVHAKMQECFEWHRKKQTNQQGKMHPNGIPFCVGDGKSATRWMGKDVNDFQVIECPNEKCEFAMIEDGAKKCKPWMRFLFRVRWSNNSLPTGLFKFSSQSWNNVQAWVGFFDYVLGVAKQLGIESPSLFGLPFTMTLAEGTKPSIKARFPIVNISTDIEPLEFFRMQKQLIAQISDGDTRPVALIDSPEKDDAVILEDWKQIAVPANMTVQIQTSKPSPEMPEPPPVGERSQAGQGDKLALLESYRQSFAASGKEKKLIQYCDSGLKFKWGTLPKDFDFAVKQIKMFAKNQGVELK